MPYSFVLLQPFAAKRKHVLAPQIIEKNSVLRRE